MNIRIIYSLIIALGLYAQASMAMIRRTGQRATDTISRTGSRITSPLRSSTASTAAASRSLYTQPRSNIIQTPVGYRAMSTYQTSFQKPWKVGATPWEILGVSKDASYQEAQKAYRKIIQQVHPDKNLSNLAAATQATQEANDALTWFKQDPISRMYTAQDSTTSSTAEPTEEQKRKDKESYEYYKKRAGSHSYAYYQQRGSNALNALYGVLIATGLVAAAKFTGEKVGSWSLEKEKSKDLQKLITQINELYTEFEKHKFPKLLVEHFTLELEELKNQAVSKLNAAKNRRERIELLVEYNFLLEYALLNQQHILKKYIRDPAEINWAVGWYEKDYSRHKKIFENSPRRDLLPEDTYKLPSSSNFPFMSSLKSKIEQLENEIVEEEEKQQLEQSFSAKAARYTDWAKNAVYDYWNRFINATGLAK